MKQHVEQLQMLWQLSGTEQKILHQEHELQNIASAKDYRQKKRLPGLPGDVKERRRKAGYSKRATA